MSGNHRKITAEKRRLSWLRRAYPSMSDEIDRLAQIEVPASFLEKDQAPDTDLNRAARKQLREVGIKGGRY